MRSSKASKSQSPRKSKSESPKENADIVLADEDFFSAADFKPENVKERITTWIDEDIVDWLRTRAAEVGGKYQTLLNETLRAAKNAELAEDEEDEDTNDQLISISAIETFLRQRRRVRAVVRRPHAAAAERMQSPPQRVAPQAKRGTQRSAQRK